MIRKTGLAVILLCISVLSFAQQQLPQKTKQNIQAYLTQFKSAVISNDNVLRVTDITADSRRRTVTIRMNEVLGERPISKAQAAELIRELKRRLPTPYNAYTLSLFCGTLPFEQLIEPDPSDTIFARRIWGAIEHKGYPWTTNASRPYTVNRGLQGRHLAIWASHGRYYDLSKSQWRWQRPSLYCTTEDLFTQSFVVPFLMPMLENAGAIVWSPRERDWQRREVVVDNDSPFLGGTYSELSGQQQWRRGGPGFGYAGSTMVDGDAPFLSGTYRVADAQTSARHAGTITWTPLIDEEGDYAVYVSFAQLPTNVPDATYTVRHSGVATTYKVNQQMGGGTWVYLGTHHFIPGNPADNCIKLTNQSNYRGTITADAVRLGGGMGSVTRGDCLYPMVKSNLPRYLEGSRYSAQWGGAPYAVYANREAQNDYTEDINTRSLWTNYLARGSAYLPGDSGLCVPIELSLGVHSDAGLRPDRSLIGTLGIYTTGKYTKGEYEGLLAEGLLPAGLSRMTSRDFINGLMTGITADLTRLLGKPWNRRQMFDRNYSESRVPEVPAAILETLSHQNWADLVHGHDPWFKFLLARSIYKGILRYVAAMHGQKTVTVQPLPVSAFAAFLNERMDSVRLSWQPTPDPLEPTAAPTAYLVQTAEGNGDWTNGTLVHAQSVNLPVRRGILTRYRVSALNAGGQSLPGAELVSYVPQQASKRLLVINGFRRLAGPQPVDNDSLRGFDIDADPGVVYHRSPCYSGRQTVFAKSMPAELGASGSELESLLVAGNTFDYPTLHARYVAGGVPGVAVMSCMGDALNRPASSLPRADLIDVILGTQRQDGYSMTAAPAFTDALMNALSYYSGRGAGILCSGAYLSEEIHTEQQRQFAARVLHLSPAGTVDISGNLNTLMGLGVNFTLCNTPNERSFSATRCSTLQPLGNAFAGSLFTATGYASSVGWTEAGRHTLTYGFPLEMISDESLRRAIVEASIKFLIQ